MCVFVFASDVPAARCAIVVAVGYCGFLFGVCVVVPVVRLFVVGSPQLCVVGVFVLSLVVVVVVVVAVPWVCCVVVLVVVVPACVGEVFRRGMIPLCFVPRLVRPFLPSIDRGRGLCGRGCLGFLLF